MKPIGLITFTGKPVSENVECLSNHDMVIVEDSYLSKWKECKNCGFRTIEIAPLGKHTVDFSWLYHTT